MAQPLKKKLLFFFYFILKSPQYNQYPILHKDRLVHIIRLTASGEASFTPLSKSPPYWAPVSPAGRCVTLHCRGLLRHLHDWAHEQIVSQILKKIIQSKKKRDTDIPSHTAEHTIYLLLSWILMPQLIYILLHLIPRQVLNFSLKPFHWLRAFLNWWISHLHHRGIFSPSNTAATVRQRDGKSHRRSIHCRNNRRTIEIGVYELHQMLKKQCYVSASQEENWPTFNSIPKWYDAVCQSVGKASDITTPGQ